MNRERFRYRDGKQLVGGQTNGRKDYVDKRTNEKEHGTIDKQRGRINHEKFNSRVMSNHTMVLPA